MRKFNYIAIFFFFSFLALAAQEREETAFGWRLNGNRNLGFEDSTKVHTEICGGAHVTFGDINAEGIDFGMFRVYTPSQNFAFAVGGMMSFDYNKDFGSMTDFLAQGKIGLGKSYGFELVGMAGVGQLAYRDNSTNGIDLAVYHNTVWRSLAGGEFALFAKASKNTQVRLFGRFLSYFNHSGDRRYEEAEGWTHTPTRFNLHKVSVGGTVSIRVGGPHQISGDRCPEASVYTGYEFGTNKGPVIGAELLSTKRPRGFFARIFGVGIAQTFGEGTAFNQVYGKLGCRYLPLGSESPVIFEFGIKAGIGEYLKEEAGSTDTNSYSMQSTVQVPGVVSTAVVGVDLHKGRCCWKLRVEGGGHAAFKTSFESNTSNYDGLTRHRFGGDGSATIGLEIAL